MSSETLASPRRPGLVAQALALADRTPDSRNRTVDFLRAISILAVVVGHWLVAAPYVVGGEFVPGHLLSIDPWTRWLTWVFQVMPVFFLVGGYSNGSSWRSARAAGERYAPWLRTRMERLIGPVLPVLVAWSALACAAKFAGVSADGIIFASRVALVPVWFLAVYLLIVAAVPLTQRAWHRFGLRSVAALVAGAVAVDVLRFVFDIPLIGYLNYAFVWLAIHQLGYAWRDGRLASRTHALVLASVSFAALLALVSFGPYPIAMIGVPGAEVSNSTPPSLALLALGLTHAGLVLALEAPLRRWLARRRAWAAVVLVNGMIMSVYLWHMTALIIAVVVAHALGDPGLQMVPSSGSWWLARPVWLAIYALPLGALVAGFVRFERRGARAEPLALSKRRAVAGAVLVCTGLWFVASGGIAASGTTGVRVFVLAQPLLGAALAGFGPLAGGLGRRARS